MKVHEKKHSCDPRSQTPSAPCVNIKKKNLPNTETVFNNTIPRIL